VRLLPVRHIRRMGNIRAFKLSIRLGEQRKEGEEFRFPGRSSSVFPRLFRRAFTVPHLWRHHGKENNAIEADNQTARGSALMVHKQTQTRQKERQIASGNRVYKTLQCCAKCALTSKNAV